MGHHTLSARRIDRRNGSAPHAAARSYRTDIVNTGIGKYEIHAYVDGLLSGGRRKAVEIYLEQHPEHAAIVEAYTAQIAAMKRSFSDYYPMSSSLRVLCEQLNAASARHTPLARHPSKANPAKLTAMTAAKQPHKCRPDHRTATEKTLPPRR
jgi:anti-sigma factor RsiW